MSLFKKLKKSMGIGTLTFELVVPSHVAGSSGEIAGEIVITAKSAQHVKDVEVAFNEVFEWEERESRYDSTQKRTVDYWDSKSRTTRLGYIKDEVPFELSEGEIKKFPFVIPFQPFTPSRVRGSSADDGVWGFLGSAIGAGTSVRGQRIKYEVKGDVDLVDVAFDKGDTKRIIVT